MTFEINGNKNGFIVNMGNYKVSVINNPCNNTITDYVEVAVLEKGNFVTNEFIYNATDDVAIMEVADMINFLKYMKEKSYGNS